MEKIDRQVHTLDATDVSLGRLASKVAQLLRGKHKPTFSPHLDEGDSVVIENIKNIKITGNKLEGKIYYRHSQYPGGLKKEKMKDLIDRRGIQEVFKKAVFGMLPDIKLRPSMLKRLTIK
jgi:large subunit ribosomal protein L13